MQKIFLINGHQPWPFSEGRLNATLAELAESLLREQGCEIRRTTMLEDWDLKQELEKHEWADAIILQTPVNWMGVTWSFKKYMDEVYTAGMDGSLCDGDGRSRSDPGRQYGSGGKLSGRKYMLSLTFNAPADAFDDSGQYLFQGRSVDDLFFPMHMNFRFFGMEPMASFASFDVLKNPRVEEDLVRYRQHLAQEFAF